MKILVTGGSGLIGRWVLSLLQEHGHETVNLDLCEPEFSLPKCKYVRADIGDAQAIASIFERERPDCVIHLAARIDLDGKSIDDYDCNTEGVRTICKAVRATPSIQRAIYTSSQLVCKVGYVPIGDADYCPNNYYGQSKVITEKIVREENAQVEWCLVRPTTVWGPHMNEHYQSFLRHLKRGTFFHFSKKPLYKSYSYAGNIAFQYLKLLTAPKAEVHQKTFYLADYEPIALRDYVDSLALHIGAPRVKRMPYPVAKALALCGDLAQAVGIKSFPFTSFRLNNILTEYQFDMSPTKMVCGELPYTFEDGVKATAEWFLNGRNP
jgi:GlcNAc-P-P-Und epimerase